MLGMKRRYYHSSFSTSITKIANKYYEWICVKILKNRQVIKNCVFLEPTQNEIKNLHTPMILNEIESVIKHFVINKLQVQTE